MSDRVILTEDKGVTKKIIKSTEDLKPNKEQYVFILYEAQLENGIVFEKEDDFVNPYKFQIGKWYMIKGLEIAILSMNIGEKAIVYISSDYAYGEYGCGKDIPPNTNLVYTIELIDIMDKHIKEIDFEEILILGKELKESGDTLFKTDSYAAAVEKYECAIDHLRPELKTLNDEDTKLYCDLLLNTAKCLNKMADYFNAIDYLNEVMKLNISIEALFERTISYINIVSNKEELAVAHEEISNFISVTEEENNQVKYLKELLEYRSKTLEETYSKSYSSN